MAVNFPIEVYRAWSKIGHIHFGYRGGSGAVFHFDSMGAALNDLVFEVMSIQGKPLAVLDLGCGTGASLLQLAYRNPDCTLFGVNSDPEQVTEANRSIAASHQTHRITVCHSDFHTTDFEDGSFDRVYAIESCCYAVGKDKSGFFRESARLIKKGGRLVVADGFLRNDKPLPFLLHRLYRLFLASWGIEQLGAIPNIAETLTSHGFRDVAVMDISIRTGFSLLHIPLVWCRLLFQEWKNGNQDGLWPYRKQYAKALMVTALMPLAFRHLGYFVIVANRA